MKKLIVLYFLIFIGLNGCALYEAYNMARFDNIEYALINKVHSLTEIALSQCENKNRLNITRKHIYNKTMEFENYTQYIPNNQEAFKLATNITKLSKQTNDFYDKNNKVSTVYCKAKFNQILNSSIKIQQVIGKKPR